MAAEPSPIKTLPLSLVAGSAQNLRMTAQTQRNCHLPNEIPVGQQQLKKIKSVISSFPTNHRLILRSVPSQVSSSLTVHPITRYFFKNLLKNQPLPANCVCTIHRQCILLPPTLLKHPKSWIKENHWYWFCEITTTVLLLLHLISSNPEKVLENIPDRAAGIDWPNHIGMVGYSNNFRSKLARKNHRRQAL